MRIVYVLTSLGIGGAERQALNLAERMRERGHGVAVFTLMPRLPEEWPTSLPVFRLGLSRNPFSYLPAFLRARRYLRDIGPHIVHSHSYHANIFARLLKVALRKSIVISTIHNIYEGGQLRMLLYRATDSLSTRTIAVSQAVAGRFTACRAVPAAKCSAIPNAIDLATFTPDAAHREQLREVLNAGSDFIWLAIGRLAPAKDYPNLLRAFAQVHAQIRKPVNAVQLWIAGEGSSEDTAALHALARQLNLAGSVQWLGLRRDMPALLDAADAFVMSSAWEGMPLALGEAMAMQKPVVATEVGGVCELVGDAGTIVPARNAEKLAEAMLALMRTSFAERVVQGHAAREHIAARFSIDTCVLQWESLYWKLFRQPS
jgi:glycosyltransferase involved in cell wall biosynthesis